jgi:hypothetical protein
MKQTRVLPVLASGAIGSGAALADFQRSACKQVLSGIRTVRTSPKGMGSPEPVKM